MSGPDPGRRADQAIQAEDLVWRALKHPVRRRLLDELASGGRSTSELTVALADLTRYGIAKHLALLDDAQLVTSVRWGRYKLHFLTGGSLIGNATRSWLSPPRRGWRTKSARLA